jgi:transcriptional regulator with XRE-family HTH domain
MELYSIIKERRSLLGLTQQDLADYTGLSLRIIKNIESGKGNPSLKTLTKIADILGVELILKIKEKER